jgi:hypothetical protein
LLIQEGRTKDGMRIIQHVYDRYHAAGLDWNHIECGGHYVRPLDIWQAYMDLAGFRIDATQQRLWLDPQIAKEEFRCVLILPDAWLAFAQLRKRTKQVCRIVGSRGNQPLQMISLGIPKSWKNVKVQAEFQGKVLGGKTTCESGFATFRATRAVRLTQGTNLELHIERV